MLKKKVELNRDKLLKVLRRRKTLISTKELAMKANVNYNSARRDLLRLHNGFMVDREMQNGNAFWRLGIADNG